MLNEENTKEWYTPEYRQGHYRGQQASAHRRRDPARPTVRRRRRPLVHRGRHGVARRQSATTRPATDTLAFLARAARRQRVRRGADRGCRRRIARRVHPRRDRARAQPHRAATSAHRSSRSIRVSDNEASFFGPVISKAPTGADALELWDAVETLATMSGMAELKRSNSRRARLHLIDA